MEFLSWWQIAVCASAAFLGGFATAISGSGGLFTIPIYLIVNLPPFIAFGTNKAVLASGLSLSSWRFYKKDMVDWKVVLPWILPAFFITAVSTMAAIQMNERGWTFLIAIVILVATFTSYPGRKKKQASKSIQTANHKWNRRFLLGAVYVYDGIAGPLSGALAYLSILKTRTAPEEISEHAALGSTRVLHFTAASGSAVVLAFHSYVAWTLVPVLAVFSMAGNYTGAEVAAKMNPEGLRWVLFIICLISAVGLLIKVLMNQF